MTREEKQNLERNIQIAINKFSEGDFIQSSLDLLNTLGYESDRQSRLKEPNYQYFKKDYISPERNFNEVKALVHEWIQIDFLFQLTEEELQETKSLFGTEQKVDTSYVSYLFFALELRNHQYTRTQLSHITREINKLVDIPAMVLFRHGETLTLSIINRRPNKKKTNKDVLEKVTLIKDIRISNPHRAHIEILFDLSLYELSSKHTIDGFDDFHKAIEKVLDIRELNRKFYGELSNWYYYANSKIRLPFKPEYYKSDDDYKKDFVVRLICRTIFCWFLKEKGLISQVLLEVEPENTIIRHYLKSDKLTEREFGSQNSYFRGILQHIFFAALNTPMSKHKNRNIKEYYGRKYISEDFDYDLFNSIPYLNGGLFENLDEDVYNEKYDDETLKVSNELFFSSEHKVKIAKKEIITCGLNRIFAKYKFTITENTPLEEEIALDPELLGHVFENLLVELDPDINVSNNARRYTGTFYTPRKVIEYMVNESLLKYLTDYLKNNFIKHGLNDKQYLKIIRTLIYQNRLDSSNENFINLIIQALDQIKVLDPACGSGAFPMGMLNRIVAILEIIDPDNIRWLEKQLLKVPVNLREDTKISWQRHQLDYTRKLGLIKNCIYGIDNQPIAVMITKLRIFITLLIDQEVDIQKRNENYHIEPLPNLETKIICADSLIDSIESKNSLIEHDKLAKYITKREEYYANHHVDPKKREHLAEEIVNMLADCFPDFAESATGIKYQDLKSKKEMNFKCLYRWFKYGSLSAPFTNFYIFYPELEGEGFDIVIGNPPYGGKAISDDLQKTLELGSSDPYGAFIARFLGNGSKITPLKKGGILAYIVSDTFMTIKTHYGLRYQMMQNYIHKMIRVHPDTFRATVNTAIILCQKNLYPASMEILKREINPKHYCLMVDMTSISIHERYERFMEILQQTKEKEKYMSISTPEYAIYNYPQTLIKTNTNLPFFVASPKLFSLLNDKTSRKMEISIGDKTIEANVISVNSSTLNVVKLKNIASVKQGLATGDNKNYLFQNQDARGRYRSIMDYENYLLSEMDLEKIRQDNSLRLEVIDKGISKNDKRSTRYFGGRYIIPYDKGGESDADEGWLPNYYVPTNYFIDWSEWALNRMKKYTIAQRIRDNDENKIIKDHYEKTPCAILRNSDTYFKEGLTFSITGVYAPTFRLCSGGTWDVKGSFIETETNLYALLGILASKLIKYYAKSIIYHTVDFQVDAVKELPVVFDGKIILKIQELVKDIIEKQKGKIKYNYSKEQELIDKYVYSLYELNQEDIDDVENWYIRRYPNLVKRDT